MVRTANTTKNNSNLSIPLLNLFGVFNFLAALLGPIWFGMRGIWNWCLVFIILETFACVQIVRGLFGDIAAAARENIKAIEFTLELRRTQLQEAIESNADNIEVFKKNGCSIRKFYW